MTKLLDTYRNDPTYQNARKVLAHDRKHPMASCLLGLDDIALLRKAERQALGG